MTADLAKSASMFENPEIERDDLPQVESVSWLGMDAKFVRRLLVGAAIGLFFVTVGIFGLQMIFNVAFAEENINVSIGWFWLLLPVIALPLFIWPLISVPRMGYSIREKDIIFKSGVFWHTVTAIPFNRIQHVEKSSAPLDRRFGIATLQLFTAGGTGGDLKIHGLSSDVAENLRVFILDKVGASIEHH
jgi:membrane protein YdbS with pleckstrin-like domain